MIGLGDGIFGDLAQPPAELGMLGRDLLLQLLEGLLGLHAGSRGMAPDHPAKQIFSQVEQMVRRC
jgi:hypothetical protein